MAEGVWDVGGKPLRHKEEETAFKEVLIPIVRNAFVIYEGKGWFDEAARFARALDDKASEKRLLRKLLRQKDIKPCEYEQAGLLAIAAGDFELAEEILEERKKNIRDYHAGAGIVNLVIRLPTKIAKIRAMGIFEEIGDYGRVFNIAAGIGDRETSERLLKKMVDEGHLLYCTETDCVVEAALYNPVSGKRLVKELLTPGRAPKDREEWYVSCAGEVSAALGDRVSAEKAFDYLMENKQSSLCQLKAGKIAVALGNIRGAEESVWGARATLFKFDLWDRGHLNDLGYIIGSVAKRNVEGAERIWKYVEEIEFIDSALPLVAVRILEIV